MDKLKHEANVVLTCATAPSTTMMVALAHHSPEPDGRHETDAWIVLSADPTTTSIFSEFQCAACWTTT